MRKKIKSNRKSSKQSGNQTYLELKRTQFENQDQRVISNYYKDVDEAVARADSTLINTLYEQVVNHGVIYAIHVLKLHLEESPLESLQRLHQTSKLLFCKPDGENQVYKDTIYSRLAEDSAICEVPIEFLVDAATQDGSWYSQVDRSIPLAISCLCSGDKTENLVPRALETWEYQLLSEYSTSSMESRFMEQQVGDGTGKSNANNWLETDVRDKSNNEAGVVQYELDSNFPLLTATIEIDKNIGMTNEQIKFIMSHKSTLAGLDEEIRRNGNGIDLSFVIPTEQRTVKTSSKGFAGIVKYFSTLSFELNEKNIPFERTTADEDVAEEDIEYTVLVEHLIDLGNLINSGITRPWKSNMVSATKVTSPKSTKASTTGLTANLKILQKFDEGKEKVAEKLESCIRHLQQTGSIIPVIPSTAMTNINGKEVFSIQKGRLIRAGKLLGKKSIISILKWFSGQIYIFDIWTRVFGKIIHQEDPKLQNMALAYFHSMFTPEGVEEVNEKNIENSLLTKVIFKHSYGNMAMSVVWKLAEQGEDTVSKISLLNQISFESLLEPVMDNQEEKYFFRRDLDLWILDVGKLIKNSGDVCDEVDLLKVMFGIHPLIQREELDDYPMRNWEKITGEVHLEKEKYPGLIKSIEAEDAWKSLRGRSFGKISMICKVIRRSNERIDFTKELTNSTMEAFMTVFTDKKEEWNSSNTEGYVVDLASKLPQNTNSENDPEDISTESALSVMIGVDPKELIPKLDELKIYQLQKIIGTEAENICANNVLTKTCPYGKNCVNRHESVLNHEDSRSLKKGVKKLLTGDENHKKINVTFKHGSRPFVMQQQYNRDHPPDKAYPKKKTNKIYPRKKATETKGVNEVKTPSKEENGNGTSNRKSTWIGKGMIETGKGGKGRGRGGSNYGGRGGKGKGYTVNGYRGKGKGANRDSELFRGGKGYGGRGNDVNRNPPTNRGNSWKTGDVSVDGKSVYIGNNSNQKMTFINRSSYDNMENAVYRSMKAMFQDMIHFGSTAGFAKFFQKCSHGCHFHSLHSKTCICGHGNSPNCGVYPCVVNVFLPRLVEQEKVGMTNLSRNINMVTPHEKNYSKDVHTPWRAAMSRRQIRNDIEEDDHSNYLNNMMAQEMIPEADQMTFYKSQEEIEQEETKMLKKLNSLKEMKGKMKGLNQMRGSPSQTDGTTRYFKINQSFNQN